MQGGGSREARDTPPPAPKEPKGQVWRFHRTSGLRPQIRELSDREIPAVSPQRPPFVCPQPFSATLELKKKKFNEGLHDTFLCQMWKLEPMEGAQWGAELGRPTPCLPLCRWHQAPPPQRNRLTSASPPLPSCPPGTSEVHLVWK